MTYMPNDLVEGMEEVELRAGEVEEKLLRKWVYETQVAVDKALQKHFGCRLWKIKRVEDQLRLVTLAIWSRKYHIPLDEIVLILVTYYRGIERSRMTRAPIFGTVIPTLVGQHSERILQERLKRKYPERENEQNWRQELKDDQLQLLLESAEQQPEPADDVDSVGRFLHDYRNSVEQSQKGLGFIKTLKRRRYRNCPW